MILVSAPSPTTALNGTKEGTALEVTLFESNRLKGYMAVSGWLSFPKRVGLQKGNPL